MNTFYNTSIILVFILLMTFENLFGVSPSDYGCVPPPPPTNTTPAANMSICNGKVTTLSVSGSGTIGWYSAATGGTYLGGGSNFLTPVLTANTTYYAQDSTCDMSTRTSILVTVNALPNVTASASSTSICFGSGVTLASSNASSYIWTPGPFSGSSITITPGGSTTYTVTGTNSAGCTKTSTIFVAVNPLPNVGTSVTASTICAGSSTTMNGTGATFYNWQPGTLSGTILTVSPAVTTTYTVTGVNFSSLCTNTATRTITVNPVPPTGASASVNTICNGESTVLTGSGANTYVWNPGALSGTSVTVNPGTTTTYTVTGTSTATGCTAKSTVAITVNPLPGIGASANPASICIGSSTTLTATGGSTYTWEPGALSGSSISVSPTNTTTYTVTGTNANLCVNTSVVTVTVNPLPTVGTTVSASTICLGGSSTINGTGANTYSWQPGSSSASSISVSPVTATTYTVTGTNTATGCSNTALRTINVNSIPTIGSSASLTTICSGVSTSLSATGADSYLWNPGGLTGSPVNVTPLNTTTYTVVGTSSSTGCTGSSTITITVNQLPNVVTSVSSPSICLGGSTTITGNGANTYTWEPGALTTTAITVSPGATTTYTITGTNTGTGCSKTNTRTITVNPLPPTAVSATSTSVCLGSSTTLTATGANTYIWSPTGSMASAITVSPTGSTTYVVTGSSSLGCTKTASLLIIVNGVSNVNTSATLTSICPGGSTTLSATGSTSYVWQPGSLTGTPITVSPTTTTTYTVTGTNATGCTKTATRTINVLFCGATVNLKLYLEGYYLGGGLMNPALMNQSVAGATATQADTITVELRNSTSPYGIAHSLNTILNTNGTALCNFPISGNYYLAVKHRNGLQTWSANPVVINSTPLTYDFSTASSQAYGSNQVDMGGGVYGFYSGDLNLDENIDLIDMSILEADISNFIFGYYPTDLNGDGNSDILDSPIVEANINNFVYSHHP